MITTIHCNVSNNIPTSKQIQNMSHGFKTKGIVPILFLNQGDTNYM